MAETWGSPTPSSRDDIDEYVERIIRAAPPFSERQRARIAAILNGEDVATGAGQQVRDQATRSGGHVRREGARHE